MTNFVHFATKVGFLAATLGTEYTNDSIVFIKDSQEIWTHGQFYSIPDTYKTKITSLETAVAALEEAKTQDYAVRKISDGTTTFVTANNKETLTFEGGANTSVTVDNTGKVTIASTLGANAYYPTTSGEALEERIDDLEGAAVNTINGSNAVEVTGTGTTRTVALKLNNEGKNVTLSQTEDGLSAEVTNVDALVPVDGVAANDKVLTLKNKKLGATIALSIDSTADEDGKKYIRLTGVDGADLGKVDIADFVKDGMLDAAQFNQTNHTLTLTFNTASGKDSIDVDLSSLVDVYDGSTVKLKNIAIPEASGYEEPAAMDTVDSAISNLIARDNQLEALITAYGDNFDEAQKETLTSIDKGTDGDFVTTTVGTKANNKQTVAVAVKTDVAVEDATSTNNGLATAFAVKKYVQDMLSWSEY